jgi:tRNA A-37 threonylcarbamoyl transferase component Bud32
MKTPILIGSGTTSIVLTNDYNTVSKMFDNMIDFNKEVKNMKDINKVVDKLYNIQTMISYDNNTKSIEYKYIPYNLEEILKGNIEKVININSVIIDIIKILQSLHENNIVHGDFKAKNIQLTEDLKPFVIDLGSTKIFNHDLNKNDIDNLEKLKREDIDKLWYLIIQLVFKIEYKLSYKKNTIKEFKKNNKNLFNIYNSKNKYNLVNLIKIFETI